MSSVYEFSSGQVTYTTVGLTGSTGATIPITIDSSADLAANNMVIFPGSGYISNASYDEIVANVTSVPRPSFSLEMYVEFKGDFSVTTYSGIDTHTLLLIVSVGRFGTFRVPLFCYAVSPLVSPTVASFNATSIISFDSYDTTLPDDAPYIVMFDNTSRTRPSFTGVLSYRMSFRSQ